MKLKDVKDSIDNFFDNISAENLYRISVLKYGFYEITFDLENNHFEKANVSHYDSKGNQSVFNDKNNEADGNLPLAA